MKTFIYLALLGAASSIKINNPPGYPAEPALATCIWTKKDGMATNCKSGEGKCESKAELKANQLVQDANMGGLMSCDPDYTEPLGDSLAQFDKDVCTWTKSGGVTKNCISGNIKCNSVAEQDANNAISGGGLRSCDPTVTLEPMCTWSAGKGISKDCTSGVGKCESSAERDANLAVAGNSGLKSCDPLLPLD